MCEYFIEKGREIDDDDDNDDFQEYIHHLKCVLNVKK